MEEAHDAFGRLTELRAVHDWRPAVRMTPWTPETEGHMIVIEPNGNAQAWPVYDQPDLFLQLGNLLEEPVTAIWDRYPYKANHYAKYLGPQHLHRHPQRPVMRTYTNLTWPDDPYRTGQQLYRRPVPRLAAFTAWPDSRRRPAGACGGRHRLPAAAPHPGGRRVTEQTLTFGFRAASADDPAEMPGLAAVADLDLMQARRHAAVLAGLPAGRRPGCAAAGRRHGGAARAGSRRATNGRTAVRRPAGRRLFDCGLDLPGGPPLERACQQAGIATGCGGPRPRGPASRRQAAALAVERALVIALVCARHQGRYEWAGILSTGQVMAAATWDCLPWPAAGTPGALACQDAVDGRADAERPSAAAGT